MDATTFNTLSSDLSSSDLSSSDPSSSDLSSSVPSTVALVEQSSTPSNTPMTTPATPNEPVTPDLDLSDTEAHVEFSSQSQPHPDPIVSCTYDMSASYQRLQDLAQTPVITLSQVKSLPKVDLTDELDDLQMYCYSRTCDVGNADSITQDTRGVVFDGDKLVSRAFGYTPMYSTSPEYSPVPDDIKQFISENLNECKVYPSYEGALIRAFNHNQKWYLTTHRKLDAFKSYWGSRKSFGQMFLDGLESFRLTCPEFAYSGEIESFYQMLNPSRQYVFLVMNTMENRIVCMPPSQPCTFHVATFDNGVQVDEPIPGFPTQHPISGLESYDQIIDLVNNSSPFQCQGVVVFMPNGKQVKICSFSYMSLFALRGNEASVMFRYLQIRKFHGDEFHILYPEHSHNFSMYESALQQVATDILQAYRKRFINREQVVLPQEEFRVMSELHTWYKSQRSTGNKLKVGFSDVQRVLNASSPTALNKMIRRVLKIAKTHVPQVGTEVE